MLEYTGWDTMHMLSQRQEKIERDRQRAVADKALRDHFAAAALTGLLARRDCYDHEIAVLAWDMADAMLRERERKNHDAAPAAKADLPDERPPNAVSANGGTPCAASRDGSGTGDTPVAESATTAEPVAFGVMRVGGRWVSILDNAIQAETSRASFDKTENWVHEIVPLYRLPPVTEPMPKEKRAEGSAEPVAWAVCCPGDGNWSPCFFHEPHAQRHASAILGSKNVIPLYRQPPCQDFSQKNLTLTDAERDDLRAWLAECLRQASIATDGANEELAERWQARAARAAAMIERPGGGR